MSNMVKIKYYYLSQEKLYYMFCLIIKEVGQFLSKLIVMMNNEVKLNMWVILYIVVYYRECIQVYI